MKTLISLMKSKLIILLLACCSLQGLAITTAQASSNYTKLSWEDLVPPNWDPNKVFYDMTEEEYDALTDDDFQRLNAEVQKMFDEAPVINSLDGKKVKLPGFILPLEFNQIELKEFLLVPYFGACTHTPPPPANQIVFAKFNTATKIKDIYSPVWISGTLETKRANSELTESGVADNLEVNSAYSMTVEAVELYDE